MMNLYPVLFIALVLLLAFYFILRRKKTTPVTLSASDLGLLDMHVVYYRHLDQAKKKLFVQKIADFLASVKIEGVGVEVEPLDRLLVASSAVIPIFGFDNWAYGNLGSVVLYPDTFNEDFAFEGGKRNILGMVGTGYMNGQMILSKSALRHGFSASAGKSNTGIHEFVHLLDKSDGATDGIPQNLMAHEYTIPWLKMMHEEIGRINKDQSDIDPYAMTNEAEFFAVASEYFFEQPEILKEHHPGLYEQLSRIFAQHPAG
nr:M90 family metallopeptidase [Pedobacter sp. ASV12]